MICKYFKIILPTPNPGHNWAKSRLQLGQIQATTGPNPGRIQRNFLSGSLCVHVACFSGREVPAWFSRSSRTKETLGAALLLSQTPHALSPLTPHTLSPSGTTEALSPLGTTEALSPSGTTETSRWSSEKDKKKAI